MELHDLLEDVDFLARPSAPRDPARGREALTRLAHAFGQTPQAVLQELVDLAVECCGADSAGISLETRNDAGEKVFRWIVISGSFAQYVNSTAPRFFSPCGTCLDTGRPQHYRVSKPYYDYLGLTADEIRDGMLIPWVNEELRGTIWAIAHHSREAFDRNDYTLLSTLADFASIALRQQHQQETIRRREREVASAARANELAHRINNPLQSLTNTLFLAQTSLAQTSPADCSRFLEQASQELAVLASLVKQLLGRSTP